MVRRVVGSIPFVIDDATGVLTGYEDNEGRFVAFTSLVGAPLADPDLQAELAGLQSDADAAAAAAAAAASAAGTKEPALAASTGASVLFGDRVWRVFADAVRGTLLTGYTLGSNAAIAATDSILAAFEKIQAQLNAKQKTIVFGDNLTYDPVTGTLDAGAPGTSIAINHRAPVASAITYNASGSEATFVQYGRTWTCAYELVNGQERRTTETSNDGLVVTYAYTDPDEPFQWTSRTGTGATIDANPVIAGQVTTTATPTLLIAGYGLSLPLLGRVEPGSGCTVRIEHSFDSGATWPQSFDYSEATFFMIAQGLADASPPNALRVSNSVGTNASRYSIK